MELLPIIKASLGIFTLLISATFIVSFIVYKVKNRNTIKPNEKKAVSSSSLILEIHNNKSGEVKQNSFDKKFKVLNENSGRSRNSRTGKKESHRRLNNVLLYSSIEATDQSQSLKTLRRSPNEVFNIYNFYSNRSGSMYKLKVKTLTVE